MYKPKHMRKNAKSISKFLHKVLNNIKIIYEIAKVLKKIINVFSLIIKNRHTSFHLSMSIFGNFITINLPHSVSKIV